MKTAIVFSAIFDLLIFWGMFKILKKIHGDFSVLLVFIIGMATIGALFLIMMYGYSYLVVTN